MMKQLLQSLLAARGIYVSLSTIVRSRRELGWIYRGSAYCQLIRHDNKLKRLHWAQANLHDSFDNVIWSETTVQLDNHRRFCYGKDGERPRPKPRTPKASHQSACLGWNKYAFSRELWQLHCISIIILQLTLLPFIQQKFSPPNTHRFMQDNDPKHTSRAAQNFYATSGINWWCTPAESPDLNPIENLWHELKEYICREVKPTTKLELINAFWSTVDTNKFFHYINHLRKVMPRVIEVNGEATGEPLTFKMYDMYCLLIKIKFFFLSGQI